jgi:hypothetical protein
MPKTFIKNAAKKSGQSKEKLEREFKEVASKAKKEGYKNPYKVATGVVEKNTGYHGKKKKK